MDKTVVNPAETWIERALAVEPEVMQVEVQGAAVDVRAWGRRGLPGLLFLHGAGAHCDWWRFIAPYFAEHYRIAALSWTGMGASGWRESYSIDTYADEAHAVAQAAGLFDADVGPVFVAHSFGGRPALRYAAGERGDRLTGVVLVDSLVRLPNMPPPRPFGSHSVKVYPTAEEIKARFRLAPPQPNPDPRIMDFVAGCSIKAVSDERGEGFSWRFDPDLWERLEDVDTVHDLRAPRCPISHIRAQYSGLMKPEVVAYFHENAPPGTPTVIVPEAHHHLILDQPLAFIAALRGLLAGWPGPRA